MERPSGTRSDVLPLAVAFEAGLGLLALAIGWTAGDSPWNRINWDPPAILVGVAASLPMLAGLAAIVKSRWGWCVSLRRVVDELVVPLFAGCSVGQLALLSLVAGFAEELLFRGLIQAELGNWLSPVIGLVAASLLFGLAHPITVAYAAVVTIAGFYLGGLWLWSGNLLIPIVTHAVYDFVALVYLARRPRGTAIGQSV